MSRLRLLFILVFITGTAACQTSHLSLAKMRLVTVDGQPFDKSAYEGKPVFINLWATWCGPCIAEMPSLDRLARLLEKEGVMFLAISDVNATKVKKYLSGKDFTLPFALKELEAGDKKMNSLPQSFLLNKEGKVIYKKTGSAEWDSPEMVEMIRQLLELK